MRNRHRQHATPLRTACMCVHDRVQQRRLSCVHRCALCTRAHQLLSRRRATQSSSETRSLRRSRRIALCDKGISRCNGRWRILICAMFLQHFHARDGVADVHVVRCAVHARVRSHLSRVACPCAGNRRAKCVVRGATCDARRATCDVRRALCHMGVCDARCATRAVRRALCDVRRATCDARGATCDARCATCDVRRATHEVRRATCDARCATCDMRHATRDMRHATCDMRHATCDAHCATWGVRRAVCVATSDERTSRSAEMHRGRRRTSRRVSRVLSRRGAPVAAIHLGLPSPAGSSGLPADSGGPPSNACAGLPVSRPTLLTLLRVGFA